jgi:hypothetical protein
VALILAATLLAGGAEGLAGATACPNRSVIGPSGKSERIGPSSDPGEEMALGVSAQIVWLDIDDAPRVYVSGRDMPRSDQVP